MIISASTGQGFRGAISYVEKEHEKDLTPEQKPEILQENNIAGTAQEKAQQMRFVANGNSRASRPVLHVSVSFHKDEKISPQQRDKVLNDVVKDLGATKENNQYQIVKHNDAGHEHYHIVLNKVGFDGKNIDTSYIKNKCQVIADKLEQKHDLRRTQGRTIVYDPTNEKGYRYTTKAERSQEVKKPRDRALNVQQKKAFIQQEVGKALKESKSLTEFKTTLSSKGIESTFLENKKGLAGVSFRYEQQAVKGSAIGYKASEVTKSIELNSGQKIEMPKEEPKAPSFFEKIKADIELEKSRKIEKLNNDIKGQERYKGQLEDLKQHSYNVIEQTREKAFKGEPLNLKDSNKVSVLVDEKNNVYLQHKENPKIKWEVSELNYIAKIESEKGQKEREYNKELERYNKVHRAQYLEVPSALNVFKSEERKKALEYNKRLKEEKEKTNFPHRTAYVKDYEIRTPTKIEKAKATAQSKINEMKNELENTQEKGKEQQQKQQQENRMERAERLRQEKMKEQNKEKDRNRGFKR